MICAFFAGTLFIKALEAALHIPQQLPTSKPLRARFISFLHRMVCYAPSPTTVWDKFPTGLHGFFLFFVCTCVMRLSIYL